VKKWTTFAAQESASRPSERNFARW